MFATELSQWCSHLLQGARVDKGTLLYRGVKVRDGFPTLEDLYSKEFNSASGARASELARLEREAYALGLMTDPSAEPLLRREIMNHIRNSSGSPWLSASRSLGAAYFFAGPYVQIIQAPPHAIELERLKQNLLISGFSNTHSAENEVLIPIELDPEYIVGVLEVTEGQSRSGVRVGRIVRAWRKEGGEFVSTIPHETESQIDIYDRSPVSGKPAFVPEGIPPIGVLTPLTDADAPDSSGLWYRDEHRRVFLLKPERGPSEFETAFDVISSLIFIHFEYSVPYSYIVYLNGERYSATGFRYEGRFSLSGRDDQEVLRRNVITGFLDASSETTVQSDFSWNAISKSAALEIRTRFESLTDQKIENIVRRARYSNPADQRVMFDRLRSRRDSFIAHLNES